MRLQFRMAQHPDQLRAANLVQNFTKRCWKKHPRQPEIPMASPEIPPWKPNGGWNPGWNPLRRCAFVHVTRGILTVRGEFEPLGDAGDQPWMVLGWISPWLGPCHHVFWKTTTCWDHVSGPFFLRWRKAAWDILHPKSRIHHSPFIHKSFCREKRMILPRLTFPDLVKGKVCTNPWSTLLCYGFRSKISLRWETIQWLSYVPLQWVVTIPWHLNVPW